MGFGRAYGSSTGCVTALALAERDVLGLGARRRQVAVSAVADLHVEMHPPVDPAAPGQPPERVRARERAVPTERNQEGPDPALADQVLDGDLAVAGECARNPAAV